MRGNQNNLEETIYSTDRGDSDNISYGSKKDKSNTPLISIIIPLFNEENTIKNVIERIPNHQQNQIIVVDDGSTDNSVKKVQEINDRKIKIIKHEKNQGYGAAILSGFEHTVGDIIVTIDSDGQHNPEEIPQLIKPILINQADIVVGSRYLGKCYYKIPLCARVGAYFINLFLRLLFLQKVYDNQCGFRAYRKGISRLLNNMRYVGMGFSTEILFKTALNKFKITETPISVNPRKFGTSYVNLIRITRSIISCILFYMLKKLKLNLKDSFLKKVIDYFWNMIRKIKILH